MNKRNLLLIAGGVWVVVGIFLIFRGAHLYELAVSEQHSTQSAIVFSGFMGLVIGAVKGRFVLSRTARKNIARIENLVAPLKIHHVFSKPFYAFIAGMMLLGFLLRYLNGYLGGYVVVAAIYCGIGMALLVSSLVYWRTAPVTAGKKGQ
ncbi:MAG: hypothetical protein HY579_09670 [Nitrospinae bacterium]|nr:hypothetical protein [Nitrospinota bacterium]